jgi:hypothetical protein
MLKKNWRKSANVLQQCNWNRDFIEMKDAIFDAGLFIRFEYTKFNVTEKGKQYE